MYERKKLILKFVISALFIMNEWKRLIFFFFAQLQAKRMGSGNSLKFMYKLNIFCETGLTEKPTDRHHHKAKKYTK